MKLLIDECLSPSLVDTALRRGYPQSSHVTWLGMGGQKDWTIVERALVDDYVLVTNNSTDFKKLYDRQELHAGLICLNIAPSRMSLENQEALFEYALDEVCRDEPVNEVVELTLGDDGTVLVKRYALPAE